MGDDLYMDAHLLYPKQENKMSESTSPVIASHAGTLLNTVPELETTLADFFSKVKSVAASALTQAEPREKDVVITIDSQDLMKLIQQLPRPEFREAMKAIQNCQNIRFICT
jgi:CHASE2 domain-containing sensor protein